MYQKKETVRVKLADLKPHPKNPKLHNDELIEKSIGDLGYAENIVIDENDVILAGHGRVKALKKKEINEEEAIRITGWTEEEKEKYLLLANQSTILGGFDDVKLKVFDNEILDYAGLERKLVSENIIGENDFSEELMEEKNYVVLKFDNQIDWLNLISMVELPTVKALDSKEGFEKMGVCRVMDGNKFLEKVKEQWKFQ